METISEEEFKRRYGEVGLSLFKESSTPPKKTVTERVNRFLPGKEIGKSLVQAGGNIANLVTGGRKKFESGLAGNERWGGKVDVPALIGDYAQAASAIAPIGGAKTATTGAFRGASLAKGVLQGAAGGYVYDVGENLKGGRRGIDIAKPGFGTAVGAAVPVAGAGLVATARGMKNTARQTGVAVERGISRGQELLNPPPTPEKALGEVLQGKTRDLASGVKALSEVDTTGVRTYAKLNERLGDTIKRLSGEVDDTLGSDPTTTLLDDLVTTSKVGSQTVSRNYVSNAIEHLDELYTKTADDAAAARLRALAEKAKSTGLTKKEVNDLAREYGQEFGKKAFSKLGDPLTSVNAQMYENIRTGLKETARRGMEGTRAAKTDKIISSLIKTQDLIEKNVEAVNKLRQKIAERGPLEKFGYVLTKYADILSGGTIRGIVSGILPRGVGYKTLNALDLEERLARNLTVIKKALDSGSEDDLIRAIKALKN